MRTLLVLLLTLSPASTATAKGTTATVKSKVATDVYVAFGSDSTIKVSDWSKFCTKLSDLTCRFSLGAGGSRQLPTGGKYLNVSIAFGAPVDCGNTKAELNVNNPAWYDVMDVSLVDGYSNKVKIVYTPPRGLGKATTLGPPLGPTGNEKVLGVFPLGCDICVARCKPSCGFKSNCTPGTNGCKSGMQYKPDVVCQFQGAMKGGGGSVEVSGL